MPAHRLWMKSGASGRAIEQKDTMTEQEGIHKYDDDDHCHL